MDKVNFIKMHGLGNDFVVIDKRSKNIKITKDLINQLSDRKTGAGCDQLITINKSHDQNIDAIIENTSSGAMVINEVKSQFLNLDLPFGGVNASGIGRSHGYHGFLTFTNQKSMQKNGQLSMVGLTFPPYTKWTKNIIRLVSRYL